HYPEFLPWCTKAEILSEAEDIMRAPLPLGNESKHQTITPSNNMEATRLLDMHQEDEPFSDSPVVGQYRPLTEQASTNSLHLHLNYSGTLVRATLGPLFNHAANTMVEAFSKRAHELYG